MRLKTPCGKKQITSTHISYSNTEGSTYTSPAVSKAALGELVDRVWPFQCTELNCLLTTNVSVWFGDTAGARAPWDTAAPGALTGGSGNTHLVLLTGLTLCDFCEKPQKKNVSIK